MGSKSVVPSANNNKERGALDEGVETEVHDKISANLAKYQSRYCAHTCWCRAETLRHDGVINIFAAIQMAGIRGGLFAGVPPYFFCTKTNSDCPIRYGITDIANNHNRAIMTEPK
jgi:hypothetical protein